MRRPGDVVWLNDRTGFLYGQHPHGAEAMGGLTPQGYLLVNGDELVLPCGTSRPARLNRHTGALISFSLPGESRVPGGWFMMLDTQEARDVRRGEVVFDSEINRELHEGGWDVGTGIPGIRSRISVGGRTLDFSQGLKGVSGEIHTMLAADGRLFVVTLEGTLYCFGAEASEPARHEPVPSSTPPPGDAWTASAAGILAATGVESGYAVVLGTKSGRLAEELVAQSEMRVIALAASPQTQLRLLRRFDEAGIPRERLSVHCGDLPQCGLPPYLAGLVVAEDWATAGIAKGLGRFARPSSMCCSPTVVWPFWRCPTPNATRWRNGAKRRDWRMPASHRAKGHVLLTRAGALPGAVDYTETGRPPMTGSARPWGYSGIAIPCFVSSEPPSPSS